MVWYSCCDCAKICHLVGVRPRFGQASACHRQQLSSCLWGGIWYRISSCVTVWMEQRVFCLLLYLDTRVKRLNLKTELRHVLVFPSVLFRVCLFIVGAQKDHATVINTLIEVGIPVTRIGDVSYVSILSRRLLVTASFPLPFDPKWSVVAVQCAKCPTRLSSSCECRSSFSHPYHQTSHHFKWTLA